MEVIMAKDSSFDVVSQVDLSEVTNGITMATKEIKTRYDFKGSKSEISLENEELVLISDDEFKLEQLKDVYLHAISPTVKLKMLLEERLDSALS